MKCPSCKKETDLINSEIKVTSKGMNYKIGKCSFCGRSISRMIGKAKENIFDKINDSNVTKEDLNEVEKLRALTRDLREQAKIRKVADDIITQGRAKEFEIEYPRPIQRQVPIQVKDYFNPPTTKLEPKGKGEERKKFNGWIIVLIVLIVLVIGLLGYSAYKGKFQSVFSSNQTCEGVNVTNNCPAEQPCPPCNCPQPICNQTCGNVTIKINGTG